MSQAGKVMVCGLALLLLAPLARSETNREQEDRLVEQRLRKDVTFLASDECEGRGPKTQGLNKAADYLAAEFKKAGLKPPFKGSYFQPFAIPAAEGKVILAGPDGKGIELQQGKQFSPLGHDQAGKAAGGVEIGRVHV